MREKVQIGSLVDVPGGESRTIKNYREITTASKRESVVTRQFRDLTNVLQRNVLREADLLVVCYTGICYLFTGDVASLPR